MGHNIIILSLFGKEAVRHLQYMLCTHVWAIAQFNDCEQCGSQDSHQQNVEQSCCGCAPFICFCCAYYYASTLPSTSSAVLVAGTSPCFNSFSAFFTTICLLTSIQPSHLVYQSGVRQYRWVSQSPKPSLNLLKEQQPPFRVTLIMAVSHPPDHHSSAHSDVLTSFRNRGRSH